jgi:cell division cycle protein 20 (cofactor of APC complex)
LGKALAIGVKNDLFINPIDWSNDNIIGTGELGSIKLYNLEQRWEQGLGGFEITSDLGNAQSITSLAFSSIFPSKLVSGNSQGHLQIWDLNVMDGEPPQLKRTILQAHNDVVSSVCWDGNSNVYSASYNGEIIRHDVRTSDHCGSHASTFHAGKILNLKFNNNYSLLASAGADGLIGVWDPRNWSKPLLEFQGHKSLVKAIAWNPFQRNILVSGGGLKDENGSIRVWTTNQDSASALISNFSTGSQICSLCFNPTVNGELLSSHGYKRVSNTNIIDKNSTFPLIIWNMSENYSKFEKLAQFEHPQQDRILHTLVNAETRVVASVSGFNGRTVIHFWSFFNSQPKKLNHSFGNELLQNEEVIKEIRVPPFKIPRNPENKNYVRPLGDMDWGSGNFHNLPKRKF